MFSWTPRPGYAGAWLDSAVARRLSVTDAAASWPCPTAWTLNVSSSTPSPTNGARAVSTARSRASIPPLPVLWARHVRPAPRSVTLARLGRLLPEVADQRSRLNADSARGAAWAWGITRSPVGRFGWGDGGGGSQLNPGEPVGVARIAATNGGEVAVLEVLRHPPGSRARADRPAVDRGDGRDLGPRPGEKDLVGDIELGSVDLALHDGVSRVRRDLEDGVAGDPGQDVIGDGRRRQLGAADDEEVGARGLGDVPVGGQEHGFLVAAGVGVLHREAGVDIRARDLASCRDGVVVDPLPAGDRDAQARRGDVVAHGKGVDRDALVEAAQLEPEGSSGLVQDRPDVDVHGPTLAAEEIERDVHELVHALGWVRPEQPPVPEEALEVLPQEEDGEAAVVLAIRPDALEHG